MVIGALNMRFEAQLHHAEQIAEILEFAVAIKCRNNGIGKEMLAQSCRIAKDMVVHKLRWRHYICASSRFTEQNILKHLDTEIQNDVLNQI